MTALSHVQQFLAIKRLAMVGVSRNSKDFTRALFEEFRRRDYDVLPVNPGALELDGIRCYPDVQAIQPTVEGALVLTSAAQSGEVVRRCHAAGIHSIWLYRASADALAYCAENGIRVVAGECPFMFLPETAWFHRVHGFCRKLTGSYPA